MRLLLVVLVAVFLPCVDAAADPIFVEDFHSTAAIDMDSTTAYVDTIGGYARMPDFSPSLVGGCVTGGVCQDVERDGYLAYAACGDAGLKIVDLRHIYPISFSVLGAWDSPGYAYAVTAAGDDLYLADGSSGVHRIPVGDPTSPGTPVTYDTPGSAFDVCVRGDLVYVADGANDLVILDFSTPSTPTLAGHCSLAGTAVTVIVAGDRAYLACHSGGLQIVDVSDPASPTPLGGYTVPDWGQAVAVDGSVAWLIDWGNSLLGLDVSDPANPSLLGGAALPGEARAYDILLDGGRAYVACGEDGLAVFDVGDPTAPALLALTDTPGFARDLDRDGNWVAVADDDAGLQEMRIASWEFSVSFYATPVATAGTPQDVAVWGDYAYVADGAHGVALFDISDPSTPAVISSRYVPGFSQGLAVDGTRLYVAAHEYGLQILSLAPPYKPGALGSLDTPGQARAVAAAGDVVCVADGTGGLRLIDASDPMAPFALGSRTAVNAVALAVHGDLVAVADSTTAVALVSIADPAAPSLVGTATASDRAVDVIWRGRRLYVMTNASIEVFDVTAPAAPVRVALMAAYPAIPGAAVLVGDQIFAPATNGRVVLVDVADPDALDYEDYRLTPGGELVRGMCPHGDFLMTALDGAGAGLAPVRFGQREFDVWKGRVMSKPLAIGRSAQHFWVDADVADGCFLLRLSGDGFDTYEYYTSCPMYPPSQLLQLSLPTSEFGWELLLASDVDHVSPICTRVTITALESAPRIFAIEDVPGDQGGLVRIRFAAPYMDVDEGGGDGGYNLWRRVDDPALAGALAAGAGEAVADADLPGVALRSVRDRLFADPAAKGELPSGVWEVLGGFSAAAQLTYILPAATLADSCAAGVPWSVYCLTYHEGAAFCCSPPDSGYSKDNIAPGVPEGVQVDYAAGGNELNWLPCADQDFQYFRVYRGEDPGFVPAPGNLAHATAATAWTDPAAEPWRWHYKVSSVDDADNESLAAGPGETTGLEGPPPSSWTLHTNTPNPFNPATRLAYEAPPGGGAVKLRIFDARGALVRTLVNENVPGGKHDAFWDGTDVAGRHVAAGVYYARLEAPGHARTVKMTLVQ